MGTTMALMTSMQAGRARALECESTIGSTTPPRQ